MNSESTVYFLFVIIYLIIFYLYYDDYYVQRETFAVEPNYLSETMTSQIKTEYYKDLLAIKNISQVAQMLNLTNNINLTNLKITGQLNLLPPGAITAYVGLSSPEGWLICDGSVVSKLQYPLLYNIIGNTFNKSNSSSSSNKSNSSNLSNNPNNFNLPDYRGVFLRGCGAPGYNFNSSNVNQNIKYMSSQLNTLQNSSLQDHTHELVDPGHTHTYDMYYTMSNGEIRWNDKRGDDNSVYANIKASWGSDMPHLFEDKGATGASEKITITNIKSVLPNSSNSSLDAINSSNISNTDIYPCNMTINWIIKY